MFLFLLWTVTLANTRRQLRGYFGARALMGKFMWALSSHQNFLPFCNFPHQNALVLCSGANANDIVLIEALFSAQNTTTDPLGELN